MSATPSALPTCWAVDSTPEAMPASAGSVRAGTALSDGVMRAS
ncbi:hypothetical protein ACIBO5_54865 [Nonomuraea angiospora]